MQKKCILSIDGGGIRGVLPLYALIELEKVHGPARRNFAMMAGTSTGALIVAGLAAGIPAAQILDWYVKDGPEVFQALGLGQKIEDGVLGFVGRLAPGVAPHLQPELDVVADVFLPRYDIKRVNAFVAGKIGEATGDPGITLNGIKQKWGVDLLITAKGVAENYAWYFVPDNPANHAPGVSSTGQLSVVDCATASAAAPIYFAPWNIRARVGQDQRDVGPCVDGGVGTAGNPSYQACVEALCYNPPGVYEEDDTILVSLGTGHAEKMAVQPGDVLAWVQWTVGALLAAPAEQQLQLVRRHYPKVSVYRVDVPIGTDIDLGDVRAIPRLQKCGEELAANLRAPGNNWDTILNDQPNVWRQ